MNACRKGYSRACCQLGKKGAARSRCRSRLRHAWMLQPLIAHICESRALVRSLLGTLAPGDCLCCRPGVWLRGSVCPLRPHAVWCDRGCCWVGWCLAAGLPGAARLGTRVCQGFCRARADPRAGMDVVLCVLCTPRRGPLLGGRRVFTRLCVALPLRGAREASVVICCGATHMSAVCFRSVPWRVAAAWDACCQLAGGTAQASPHSLARVVFRLVVARASVQSFLICAVKTASSAACCAPAQQQQRLLACVRMSCTAGRGVSPRACVNNQRSVHDDKGV